VLAQDRARALKHTEITTGHLLLGVLGEPDGIAGKALVILAGSLDAVAGAVHARLTPGEGRAPTGNLPMAQDAKDALGEVVPVALDLGHNYVGTEHLLLALLRVPESLAAEVLTGLGASYDRVRDTVSVMLTGYQHKPSS